MGYQNGHFTTDTADLKGITLLIDTAQTTIVGQAEATLDTFLIPANSIGVNSFVRVEVSGTTSLVTASDTVIWRFKLNGTTILTSNPHAYTAGAWHLTLYLYGNGGFNSQKCFLSAENQGDTGLIYGSASIDMTIAQTLEITAQPATANTISKEIWIISKRDL